MAVQRDADRPASWPGRWPQGRGWNQDELACPTDPFLTFTFHFSIKDVKFHFAMPAHPDSNLRVEVGIRMSWHCEMKFDVFNREVKGESEKGISPAARPRRWSISIALNGH
jgi:hypothetical protein